MEVLEQQKNYLLDTWKHELYQVFQNKKKRFDEEITEIKASIQTWKIKVEKEEKNLEAIKKKFTEKIQKNGEEMKPSSNSISVVGGGSGINQANAFHAFFGHKREKSNA